MSTTQVVFTMKINGTLTDPTSVVLNDPTGTFGAKRTDTLAVVAAAGIALTKQSTGIWVYDITDPALGLTYDVWLNWVYNGIPYFEERLIIGTKSSNSAPNAIDLCTLADVHNEGMDNSLVVDDGIMQSYITAFSRAILNHLQWDILKEDGIANIFYEPNAIIGKDGYLHIFTDKANIRAVTSASWRNNPIASYNSVTIPGSIYCWPSTNQRINAHSGEVTIWGDWSAYKNGNMGMFQVQLVYDAGFAVIPEPLVVAAARLTYWGYRQRSQIPAGKTVIPELGVIISPDVWPAHVLAMLQAYINPRLV